MIMDCSWGAGHTVCATREEEEHGCGEYALVCRAVCLRRDIGDATGDGMTQLQCGGLLLDMYDGSNGATLIEAGVIRL
jgi:hypothetical protein